MYIVILTALGVGGATVAGSAFGFIFKSISHKFSDITLAAAAGVMLAASVVGLLLPALDCECRFPLLVMFAGVICGAACLNLFDNVVPHLHRIVGVDKDELLSQSSQLKKVIMFVTAIAVHNLPEGLAAGVGFGSDCTARALTIAGGIALQNIPEGMVIIGPMLAAGISSRRTFLIGLCTGLIEVFGTLVGYFAVSVSSAILPFALSFAGGTMLYVICDEMIPETHTHGNGRAASYSLLLGFCAMLAVNFALC